ncbi:MAG: hypothetical protein EOP04_27985 [Proteobacteria bacterium]|nr:MAG: hypothetical protein EOP04_27985 [Pseudomonadota bacterium]
MNDSQRLLKELLQFTPIKAAAIAAVQQMSSTLYTQQHGPLFSQSSDGMTRHSDFNRALADYIQRKGPADGIRFERSRRKNVDYIGNWIFGNKEGGQQRFSALLDKKTFEFLHMSGTVSLDRIQVYGIGKKREEFVRHQNKKISKSQTWDIAGLADQKEIDLPESWPCRLVLVSQICGPRRNSIQLFLCVVDGQYSTEEGIISIVASEMLAEVPVLATQIPSVEAGGTHTEETTQKPLVSERKKPKKQRRDDDIQTGTS